MKLLISIVSYLLKDIFWRWREQPGNILTRFTVTYVLVLPSLALLGAFVLMTNNLEAQLQRNGMDLFFVSEQVPMNKVITKKRHADLEELKEYGSTFELHQLFTKVKSPHSKITHIAAYPDSALFSLDDLITQDCSMPYLSDSLPEGMPIRVNIDGYFFNTTVHRSSTMIHKFFQGNLLLIPEGMLPRVESRGYSRITLFKAHKIDQLGTLQKVVTCVAGLNKSTLLIRSSVKLLDDFKKLKTRQLQWRLGLAIVAGAVLALILGTLSVLEYQQRAYVITLLRSFGIKRRLVYTMQLFENALIVNIAAVAAYSTLIYFQKDLCKSFGFTHARTTLSLEEMATELLLIFVCINLGVLLSSLPSLYVLKKDIGTILS